MIEAYLAEEVLWTARLPAKKGRVHRSACSSLWVVSDDASDSLERQWRSLEPSLLTLYAENPTPLIRNGGANPYTKIFGGTPTYELMDNFPWDRLQALPFDYGKPQ